MFSPYVVFKIRTVPTYECIFVRVIVPENIVVKKLPSRDCLIYILLFIVIVFIVNLIFNFYSIRLSAPGSSITRKYCNL